MKVAVYLRPERAKSVDDGEDYLVASVEMTGYLDAVQPRGRTVLAPGPVVRLLAEPLNGENADQLRELLNRFTDAQVVMLVRRS